MYGWTVVYGWPGIRIMYQSGVTCMSGLLFTLAVIRIMYQSGVTCMGVTNYS